MKNRIKKSEKLQVLFQHEHCSYDCGCIVVEHNMEYELWTGKNI